MDPGSLILILPYLWDTCLNHWAITKLRSKCFNHQLVIRCSKQRCHEILHSEHACSFSRWASWKYSDSNCSNNDSTRAQYSHWSPIYHSSPPCETQPSGSVSGGVEIPGGSVGKVSISRDMKCAVHDLEVMGSSPGQVELEVHGSLLLSHTWT